MITKLHCTEEAYACGGELKLGLVVLREWYRAEAEDENGNEYTVIWELDPDANPDDESTACDWYTPFAVYDADGRDVTDTVEVEL